MDMADLEVGIGMPVARPLAGRGEVQPGEIPGGQTAVCLHTGPYDAITAAYTALGDWIQAQGYAPAGPAYEFYLNDPTETPPQALQTLVAFPLRAA